MIYSNIPLLRPLEIKTTFFINITCFRTKMHFSMLMGLINEILNTTFNKYHWGLISKAPLNYNGVYISCMKTG